MKTSHVLSSLFAAAAFAAAGTAAAAECQKQGPITACKVGNETTYSSANGSTAIIYTGEKTIVHGDTLYFVKTLIENVGEGEFCYTEMDQGFVAFDSKTGQELGRNFVYKSRTCSKSLPPPDKLVK